MTYVFYADVFWLNQFLLHTAILLLAGQLQGCASRFHPFRRLDLRFYTKAHATKRKANPAASKVPGYRNHLQLRYIAASAIGSTCGTTVLLLSHSYYIYLAVALTLILPLMTLLAFGKSDVGVFRKRYAGCFAAAILLGGLVTALENIAGIAQIPFLSALIAFLLAERWVRLLMRRRQIQRLLYPVILRHGEQKVQINGLLDTGNLLREPFGGRPVHLVRASRLESCGITEADFLGLVPYQALGSSEELLAIYRAEELMINRSDTLPKTPNNCQTYACEQNCQSGTTGGSRSDAGIVDIDPSLIAIRPAIVAAAPDELFYGKEYDAILNSAIITEGGSNMTRTGIQNKSHRGIANGIPDEVQNRKIRGIPRRISAVKRAHPPRHYILQRLRLFFHPPDDCPILYIGGSDTLPEPLSTDEEHRCLLVLTGVNPEEEAVREQARKQLISHNLRLVVYLAKKFENTGINVEDLISIGTIGLIKGVNTFNPDKKIKLATYASRCIENEILMYLRRNSRTRMEVSLDEPLNVDWDGNELLLSDILGADEDAIGSELENDAELQVLRTALTRLDAREAEIIELRYGINRPDHKEMTQKEVADRLGISQSYISRLEKKIMQRLKKEILRYT